MMTYEEFLTEWHNDSECIICHTSGSTGMPKQIKLPKQMVEESALRTINFFNLKRGAHLHSCISPEYIGGKMMAVRAELIGGNLTWESPSNRPLQNYAKDDIDLLAVVPSQMISILGNADSLPVIHSIIIGGSPIPPDLRKCIALSELNAWETYGMTETASHIALRKVTVEEKRFTALPGISLSRGENGNLVIDMGKWGILETNDIADFDVEGNFRIFGRVDNVIITGGRKVHPEEVERIIEPLIGSEVMVFGLPDPKWGRRVVMAVDEDTQLSKDTIINLCRQNLSKECVPKEIMIQKIPHTPNGKKLRN